jgi:hypothetical protein
VFGFDLNELSYFAANHLALTLVLSVVVGQVCVSFIFLITKVFTPLIFEAVTWKEHFSLMA